MIACKNQSLLRKIIAPLLFFQKHISHHPFSRRKPSSTEAKASGAVNSTGQEITPSPSGNHRRSCPRGRLFRGRGDRSDRRFARLPDATNRLAMARSYPRRPFPENPGTRPCDFVRRLLRPVREPPMRRSCREEIRADSRNPGKNNGFFYRCMKNTAWISLHFSIFEIP